MNRRDFLRLRVTPAGTTLEVSCRTLYMRAVDASFDDNPPFAEVIERVDEELRRTDAVRLLDSEWLATPRLQAWVEPLLSAFRARGGLVDRAES